MGSHRLVRGRSHLDLHRAIPGLLPAERRLGSSLEALPPRGRQVPTPPSPNSAVPGAAHTRLGAGGWSQRTRVAGLTRSPQRAAPVLVAWGCAPAGVWPSEPRAALTGRWEKTSSRCQRRQDRNEGLGSAAMPVSTTPGLACLQEESSSSSQDTSRSTGIPASPGRAWHVCSEPPGAAWRGTAWHRGTAWT